TDVYVHIWYCCAFDVCVFFFSSRRRHTRWPRDWSSDVCSSDLGAAFPGLDAVLLGSHPHWLTHSALPVWGLKKASEKFEAYLHQQEERIAAGELDEAERERIEFQRKITKYVGAPLLGAFSCAAGAAMFAQIVQPGAITG